MKTAFPLTLSVLLATALSAAPTLQQPPETPTTLETEAQKPAPQFVRFLDEGDHKGQLQTGIVTYKNSDGVSIDLIAVIHMADKPYYKKLGKSFEAYDALLYEITKPKGEGVDSPKLRNHPMRRMMRMQTRMMGLAGQMETIDYTKPNFVHADLDLETFQRLCKEKGDSIMGTMMKSQRSVQKASGSPLANPFGVASAKPGTDFRQAFKYSQAKQMQYLEQCKEGFTAGDDGIGSVLLTDRNKRCMEILAERLEKGDKNLGIFYGAAHMPDFEQRLLKLGFKKTDQRWMTAWDIRPRNKNKKPASKKKAGKKRRRII